MDVFRNARQNFLRRQAEADEADLERQEARAAGLNGPVPPPPMRQPAERSARSSPVVSVLRRFTGAPRPTSSRYDGASEVASPKTPVFPQDMEQSTTRRNLPQLARTWARSTAPSSGRSRSDRNSLTEPAPAMAADQISTSTRRRFDGADPAEMHLASLADEGRQRRHHRQASQASQASQDGQGGRRNGRSHGGSRFQRRYIMPDIGHRRRDPNKPKRFLYCFPFITSRRMREQILRCVVSGLVTLLMMGVFLALVLTHNVYNSEFGVLMIMIMLLTGGFFAFSAFRLTMLILHPPTPEEELADEEMYQRRRRAAAGVAGSGALGSIPNMYGPGGYAIPHEPIQVTLARDEEAAGIESVTTKTLPPAYGLWRETVRVDPNRIYWQRNEQAPSTLPPAPRYSARPSRTSRSSSSVSSTNTDSPASSTTPPASQADAAPRNTDSPRPPSYVSEDGVSYVVEAQPRSTAPTVDVPLSTIPMHPAESGRVGRPAAW